MTRLSFAELKTAIARLDWKATVPDGLQSEIRMVFNEALAGGPNMNGDGGPTLTPNHALDCVWAAQRIQSLSGRIDVLEKQFSEAVEIIEEHVPEDALGTNWMGNPDVPGGTQSWPIKAEWLHYARALTKEAGIHGQ